MQDQATERLRLITQTRPPRRDRKPATLDTTTPAKLLGTFRVGDIVRVAVGGGQGVWFVVGGGRLPTARTEGAPLGPWMWTQYEVLTEEDAKLYAVADDTSAGDSYVSAYVVGHAFCGEQ